MSTKSENRTDVNPAGVRTVTDPIRDPVISQTRQEVFDKFNVNPNSTNVSRDIGNQIDVDANVGIYYKDIVANKDLPPIPGRPDQDTAQIATGKEYQKLQAFEDQYTPYEEPTYNPLDFYTGSGEFNLALFNKVFREEQRRRQAYFRELEEKRLRDLNKEPPPPKLHQLSIGQHLFNMKDSVINIIYDIQAEPLSPEIFLKQNRLFYIGLLLLIIYILYLVLMTFIPERIKPAEPSALRVELIPGKI